MIKSLLKNIYYFLFDILILFRSFDHKYNFIVITPRLLSKLIKKSLIFDKINKNFFTQYIRDDFDLITIYEIFSEESYNLKNFEIWKQIHERFNSYSKENNNRLWFKHRLKF